MADPPFSAPPAEEVFASMAGGCKGVGSCQVDCTSTSSCQVLCPPSGCTVNNCSQPACVVMCSGIGLADYSGGRATCGGV